MTGRCTTACTPQRHSTACLFAALVESPPAQPVETDDWNWTMPFNVVTHPAMPPGAMLIGPVGAEPGPLLVRWEEGS